MNVYLSAVSGGKYVGAFVLTDLGDLEDCFVSVFVGFEVVEKFVGVIF